MPTYQLVLRMSTPDVCLRSKATGWALESGLEAILEIRRRGNSSIAAGLIKPPSPALYLTVLHALADGFKLLAPPTRELNEWDWWLVKDEDHSGQFGMPNLAKLRAKVREETAAGSSKKAKKK